MPANAEQDKASLPLMSDCTDNLLAGMCRATEALRRRIIEAINDALRALAFDVDRAERCSPERRTSACTELSDLERRQRSRLTRLGPVEAARVVTVSSMWVQKPTATEQRDDR